MACAKHEKPLPSGDELRGLPPDGRPEFNSLVFEKSPYLLQHARNPVDWLPWGEKAFFKAREEGKPVFLSIGYSTCHWCHVMERESFESQETAKILNAAFVPVKVDREERPDIDKIYMSYVQASSGGGGWPLNVWLTPSLKPFYGGTYFPPSGAWGRPAFNETLLAIAKAWKERRAELESAGEESLNLLKAALDSSEAFAAQPTDETVERGCERLKSIFDSARGGFGRAPKFPQPSILLLMLARHAAAKDQTALETALMTLAAIASGGIHDHLGGGFHRYSVDAAWRVPHFEKTLYDQAQLASAFIEAQLASGAAKYAETAKETLDFCQREMLSAEGLYLSALDADSPSPSKGGERVEGAFYTWTKEEIDAVLGEDARIFSSRYGLEEAHGLEETLEGRTTLAATKPLSELAKSFGSTETKILERISTAKAKLLAIREERPRPHVDDKAICAWNGLALSALAKAAGALEDAELLSRASTLVQAVRAKLRDQGNGRLKRRYRDGEASSGAFADDYAFLIQGLLDLYEASFDTESLAWALELQRLQIEHFLDPGKGGFFNSPEEAEGAILRTKDCFDGAEPSANSISALNLLRLAELGAGDEFQDAAESLLRAFWRELDASPEAAPLTLLAIMKRGLGPRLAIIVGEADEKGVKEFLRKIRGAGPLRPSVLLVRGSKEEREKLERLCPLSAGKSRKDGKATAYVCAGGVCHPPATNPDEAFKLLNP